MTKSKILADGNCIVCDLEVAHYKRVAPDLFEIVDISAEDFDPKPFGLSAADVNKNIHVITPDGEVKVGVDAFAHIWSRMNRYRWASRLIKSPVVHPLARAGYEVFTWIRPYLPKKNRRS